MNPVGGILQTVGLDKKSSRWAIISPQYLEMLRNVFRHVTDASGWGNQVRLMKSP
jgi:hypothetical protein